MSSTSVLRSDRRTVTQLLAAGPEAIAYLRELCKRQGLLTDKPVTGPACNLQRPWEQPA
jgi:hypothetical protein